MEEDGGGGAGELEMQRLMECERRFAALKREGKHLLALEQVASTLRTCSAPSTPAQTASSLFSCCLTCLPSRAASVSFWLPLPPPPLLFPAVTTAKTFMITFPRLERPSLGESLPC